MLTVYPYISIFSHHYNRVFKYTNHLILMENQMTKCHARATFNRKILTILCSVSEIKKFKRITTVNFSKINIWLFKFHMDFILILFSPNGYYLEFNFLFNYNTQLHEFNLILLLENTPRIHNGAWSLIILCSLPFCESLISCKFRTPICFLGI